MRKKFDMLNLSLISFRFLLPPNIFEEIGSASSPSNFSLPCCEQATLHIFASGSAPQTLPKVFFERLDASIHFIYLRLLAFLNSLARGFGLP